MRSVSPGPTPKRMKIRLFVSAALVCSSVLANDPVLAQKGVPPTTVTVAGHAMASDHDIIDNLAQSPDHTVFLSLIRSAGIVEALQGHGPFTVFAPINAAYAVLPAGLLDTLRRPENKANLAAFLSEQILPGNFSSARLRYMLRGGKGQVDLDTISDGKLTIAFNGPSNLVARDPKGNSADIVIYDVKQSNGVLFITDRVLQPG